jgi:outer membrane protein TolC
MSNLRYRSCYFAVLLFCGAAFRAPHAFAQETLRLNLEQCIEQALQNHASAAIASLRIEQAKAGKEKALGAMLPVLSSSAYGAVSTEQALYDLEVKVSQPVFLGGELLARKNEAEIRYELSLTDKEMTEADIVYSARRTFFEIKKAEASIRFLQTDFEHARRVQIAEQTLLDHHEQIQAVVLKQMTETAGKEKLLFEKQQELKTLQEFLKQLTGIDPETDIVLAGVRLPDPPEAPNTLSLEDHPLLRKLDLKIREAEEELRIAKAQRWPKVFIVSRYRVAEDSFYERNAAEAGVLAQYNIWDFGMTSGDIKEKRAKLAEEKLRKTLESDALRLKIQRTADAMAVAVKNITVSREMLDFSEEHYKNMKVLFLQGDLSFLRMNEARVQLVKAKADLTQSYCDYWIAEAEALKLEGKQDREDQNA